MPAIGSGREVEGEFGGRESENAYSFGFQADLGIVGDLNKLCRAGVEKEESIVSI